MDQQDNFFKKTIFYHHNNPHPNPDLDNVNDDRKYHCEEENFYRQEKR